MNLQRREEIRRLIADITIYEEVGMSLELENKARDALADLLAHIDALEQTAAERVIADGVARTLPQPNDATLASLAACGSTEGAVRAALSWARRMLACTDGPTPDYTGEGSAWVPPAEAPAVVVPEYPQVLVRQSVGHTERHAGILEGVEWARKNARAIPADRVLGEGMVAASLAELTRIADSIEEDVNEIRSNWTDPRSSLRNIRLEIETIRALRANQRGAAT